MHLRVSTMLEVYWLSRILYVSSLVFMFSRENRFILTSVKAQICHHTLIYSLLKNRQIISLAKWVRKSSNLFSPTCRKILPFYVKMVRKVDLEQLVLTLWYICTRVFQYHRKVTFQYMLYCLLLWCSSSPTSTLTENIVNKWKI